MNVQLRYVGTGGYILGIPARDLTNIEVMGLAAEQERTVEGFIALLVRHGLYEVVEDVYRCEICGKEYKTWDGFNNHVISKHVEPELPELEPEAEPPAIVKDEMSEE